MIKSKNIKMRESTKKALAPVSSNWEGCSLDYQGHC